MFRLFRPPILQRKSASWTLLGILVVLTFCDKSSQSDAAQFTGSNFRAKSETRTFGSRTTDNAASLFVDEYKSHDVAVLNKNGHVIQRINATGFLQTDREGDLYVANPATGNRSVKIYAPPYNGIPILITPAGNQEILNVAVDRKTDMFVVTSQANNSHGGTTELRFYRHGETTPCRIVRTLQDLPDVSALAFSADDTLYMVGNTGSGSVPASTGGGCDASPTHVYRFGNSISPFGYMAIDANNHFLVQSFLNNQPAAVYTYSLPVNGVLQPLSKTMLPGHAGFLSMDSTGAHVWGSLPSGSSILLFNYPAGGQPIMRLNDGFNGPDAMAVYPNYIPSAH